jgi:hypothetical protein
MGRDFIKVRVGSVTAWPLAARVMLRKAVARSYLLAPWPEVSLTARFPD